MLTRSKVFKENLIVRSIFVLMVLLFAVANVAAAQRTTSLATVLASSYLETQLNLNLSEEDKIKNVIDTYFNLRYESQKVLESQRFSFLVADNTKAQDWLQQEKDRQEIELLAAKTFGLDYQEYTYFLEYNAIQVDQEGSVAVARLIEGHDVVFSASAPVVSKLANLEHVITLEKTKMGWVIVNDEYEDELSSQMKFEGKEIIINRIQQSSKELQRQQQAIVLESLGEDSDFDSGVSITSLHSYNGAAAAAYAGQWWNSINPVYHDDVDNDCTNFVSQAIYEGTSHTMSVPNDYWNKWYYDFYTHTGSKPWLHVGYLKTFLTTNTGRGPFGSLTDLCSIRKGDLVQLYKDGAWSHTVIVYALVTGACDPALIFIDAHDTDRHYYPLANFYMFPKRYIDITVWRD